jgi:hypothetical protein
MTRGLSGCDPTPAIARQRASASQWGVLGCKRRSLRVTQVTMLAAGLRVPLAVSHAPSQAPCRLLLPPPRRTCCSCQGVVSTHAAALYWLLGPRFLPKPTTAEAHK